MGGNTTSLVRWRATDIALVTKRRVKTGRPVSLVHTHTIPKGLTPSNPLVRAHDMRIMRWHEPLTLRVKIFGSGAKS